VALPDSFDADVAEAVGDLPVACVHVASGRKFTATASELGTTRAIEIEGQLVEIDLMLVAARSQFATLPQSDDQVTVAGALYRILRMGGHASGIGGVEMSLKATVQ
jgi:hypothetical protein